jgi:N-acetylmuramoyl-L-alanine amidase
MKHLLVGVLDFGVRGNLLGQAFGSYPSRLVTISEQLYEVNNNTSDTMTTGIKVCLDSGHGKGNREHSRYDPGAVHGSFQEAAIVLEYAFVLQLALHELGIPTFLTRTDQVTPTLLRLRVGRAITAGCTHFVSLHCNSATDPAAHGVEVLYRSAGKALATRMLPMVAGAMELRERRIVERLDLAVLRFPGPAVLVELGFLSNDLDRAAMLTEQVRYRTCAAIAEVLEQETIW